MKTAFLMPDKKRLAVVMFLDMVGYSARMASDERTAMACVADLEVILQETAPDFAGRLVKFMGDGAMSYFPTAGQAVSCALEVLRQIRRRNRNYPPRQRFQVRIGLHLGDVVFDKGDLFGDAVNVAARVQPLGDPDGIAMTGIVYSQVRNKIPLPGVFLPPVKLKNIPVDIPIYSVAPPGRNLFFWRLRVRRRELEWALTLVVGLVVLGSLGSIQDRLVLHRWALVGVLSPGDENSMRTAGRVRLRAEMDFNALGGAQWVKSDAALAELRQRGIPHPAEALDQLDLAACHAAWRGGLSYLVLLRLNPEPAGQWGLQCRIIDAEKRVAVASFSAEGPDPPALVGKLRRETQSWMGRHR